MAKKKLLSRDQHYAEMHRRIRRKENKRARKNAVQSVGRPSKSVRSVSGGAFGSGKRA